MLKNHADDRVLVGMRDLNKAMPLIESEFGILHQALGLVEEFLISASDPDEQHWFPNNMSALACLTRAFQGLQASAVLCVMGFYIEARAQLRVVYEAAGLARALAHKPDDAGKWLHDGHWKSDGWSRKFAA